MAMGTLSAAWGAGMVIGPGIGGKSSPLARPTQFSLPLYLP